QDAIGESLTPLQSGDESVLGGAMTANVQGPVRPDSALRYSDSSAAYAYGIPIFYGDIPVPYERLGELRQSGVPQEYSSVQQRYYADFDSLSILSKKAQKQGADALINVNYRKKGRNMVTEAEMIRFTE